jgi:hypothetical protein
MSNRYTCKTCGKTGEAHFYASMAYECKECWNQSTYKRRKDKLQSYIISRGGKCQRCGYDKCLEALSFHHRDPSLKDPKWNKGWKLEKLAAELEKCDLVCHNCHAEIHQEEGRPHNVYTY